MPVRRVGMCFTLKMTHAVATARNLRTRLKNIHFVVLQSLNASPEEGSSLAKVTFLLPWRRFIALTPI